MAQYLLSSAAAQLAAAPPYGQMSAGSGQNMPMSVDTQVIMATQKLKNGMAVSGGGFQVPVAGTYQINTGATCPPATYYGYWQTMVEVNGLPIYPQADAVTGLTGWSFSSTNGSLAISLNAGDIVTLVIYNALGVAWALNAAFMDITYLGA